MCGIAGKIIFDKPGYSRNMETGVIKETLEKLKHRGPDGSGFYIDKNVWIASTRLSIIDLSDNANQPIKNEDGTILLVFNGEIYNYRELKIKYLKQHKFGSISDSEVLVHLYEEFGIHCLKYLRGMYSFAIWDARREQLFLARDRLGKKPLNFFYNNLFFVFASEIKAFINMAGVPKAADMDAIHEFVNYSYIPAPKTGFKNIQKLPPATYMVVKPDGSVIRKKYWNLDFSEKKDLNEQDWIDIIDKKIRESVGLRLRSDVPVGIHLSGGIDSSLVTAMAALKYTGKLKTLTVGFIREKEDFQFARMVSSLYKTEHREIMVKPEFQKILPELVQIFDEPFGDPSIIPTYYLMKETNRINIKVALNGDGGDENFAGYPRYLYLKFYNVIRMLPFKKLASNFLLLMYQSFREKDYYILSKYLHLPYSNISETYEKLMQSTSDSVNIFNEEFKKRFVRTRLNRLLSETISTDKNRIDDLEGIFKADLKTYLPDYLLFKSDLMSMNRSLEIRSPFLDHTLLELTSKMPLNFKLRNITSKFILKKIASKYLPGNLIGRRKKGFLPPLGYLMTAKNRSFLTAEIKSKTVRNSGIFNMPGIDNILNEHFSTLKDHSYLIFNILMFKNWYQRWF